MIAVYGRGRWTAFLSPFIPYESHIVSIYYEGDDELTEGLSNPQQMISWAPESMRYTMVQYVNERHAADLEAKK